jgi:hypothetical protein
LGATAALQPGKLAVQTAIGDDLVFDLRTGDERRVATVYRPCSPIWSPGGSESVTKVTKLMACRATPFGFLSNPQTRARFGGKDMPYRYDFAVERIVSRGR